MKHYIHILLLLCSTWLQAQILDPVTWQATVEKTSETQYNLIYTATIADNWHLYDQDLPEGGALPTEFLYDSITKTKIKLIDKPTTSASITKFDPLFEMDLTYYEHRAVFTQKIELLDKNIEKIAAIIGFQACDAANCIFDETSVSFDLTRAKTSSLSSVAAPKVDIPSTVADKEVSDLIKPFSSQKGLFTIFIIAFLSGFAALLTPCVFPMIPMTVSFFTKQSKSRAAGIKNAIVYGISIIVIYVVLGSIITAIFGADTLNALATNVWFNLAFFVLIVIFAFSFLGAFELVLPYSWANKIDRQADKGGVIGIVFMALALAIVSFSCTGPIVGTLLVEAASKGGIAPVVGMLGFSSALALPFMFFAMFPGFINALPKSGGWLQTVKVVLGFLELAFAFKFLSNADLVLQLHFLERELFLSIWIAIFATLSLYLFGKIRFAKEAALQGISVGRAAFGMLVLAFTMYLIPGLWGAPLQLISGFAPPLTYSESPYGVGYSKQSTSQISKNGGMAAFPKGAHLGPHDLLAFNDYDKGVAYAKKQNMPVLLDFTGYACVNCRKMEERIWAKPLILDKLRKEVVLISLHVDDKKELPKQQQYISKTTGKKIRTIGNKWSDLQITTYKANAQPYYVLLDVHEKPLNHPIGYTANADTYFNWLSQGIEKFKTLFCPCEFEKQ